MIGSTLLASYRKMGINVVLGHQPTAVEPAGGAADSSAAPVFRVPYGAGVVEGVDCILYAVGRDPGTKSLG